MNPFLRHAMADLLAEAILKKFDVDPALMLETAYRKRLKKAPDAVTSSATRRFVEMMQTVPDTPADVRLTYPRVCMAMWNRLSADEQRAWLLKVE